MCSGETRATCCTGPSKTHWLTPISGRQHIRLQNPGFKLRETFVAFDKARTFAWLQGALGTFRWVFRLSSLPSPQWFKRMLSFNFILCIWSDGGALLWLGGEGGGFKSRHVDPDRAIVREAGKQAIYIQWFTWRSDRWPIPFGNMAFGFWCQHV